MFKEKQTCNRIKDGENVGRQKARSELDYGSLKGQFNEY